MLIAVDTNVLIDEELDEGGVRVALKAIRVKLPKAQLVVTETVLVELGELAKRGCEGAQGALVNFLDRKYTPLIPTPVLRHCIYETAEKLRARNLVPQAEVNDALVISESAHHGCTILLTSDHHLLDAHDDAASLWKILGDHHAENENLVIAKPLVIAKRYG